MWTSKADHVVSESPMSAFRMSVNVVFVQFAFRAMTTLYDTQSLGRRDPGVQMFYLGIFGRITVARNDYTSNDDLVHPKL
jgi:hypothetical protein